MCVQVHVLLSYFICVVVSALTLARTCICKSTHQHTFCGMLQPNAHVWFNFGTVSVMVAVSAADCQQLPQQQDSRKKSAAECIQSACTSGLAVQ